eukprot:8366337-Pyramimonas_sp.AAC.1
MPRQIRAAIEEPPGLPALGAGPERPARQQGAPAAGKLLCYVRTQLIYINGNEELAATCMGNQLD